MHQKLHESIKPKHSICHEEVTLIENQQHFLSKELVFLVFSFPEFFLKCHSSFFGNFWSDMKTLLREVCQKLQSALVSLENQTHFEGIELIPHGLNRQFSI